MERSILIIDEGKGMISVFVDFFKKRGFEVFVTGSAWAGFTLSQERKIDHVLLGLDLEGKSYEETLEVAKKSFIKIAKSGYRALVKRTKKQNKEDSALQTT